jgi:hypothetical protein
MQTQLENRTFSAVALVWSLGDLIDMCFMKALPFLKDCSPVRRVQGLTR